MHSSSGICKSRAVLPRFTFLVEFQLIVVLEVSILLLVILVEMVVEFIMNPLATALMTMSCQF